MKDSLMRGVGLAFLLHVVGQVLAVVVLMSVAQTTNDNYRGIGALLWVANFGWTQLVYMLPAAIVLHVKKRPQTLKGLLIVAGIGFMITSACTGFLRYG